MSLVAKIEPRLRRMEERLVALDEEIADPEVGGNPLRLSPLLKERGRLESTVAAYRQWREATEAIDEAKREAEGTDDPEMVAYCDEVVADQEARLPGLEKELLADFVKDEDDAVNAVMVEIRAGTGGDEATLWAGDLLRMYERFCERNRFKTEILSEARSSVDGFKEVILGVEGAQAYSKLKFESGGHRVQRVPTTESQGRIHTSAATVAVLPQVSDVEVEVKDADLKIDTYSASGPGGQKVNRTASAIRITHLPTGLVVTCQDEKSQHKNKAKALRVLRTRLYDVERQKQRDARSSQRKSLIGSGDRSERIRTYNFPQTRVSDHRINLNVHNLGDVLDGDLDTLIQSLADYEREQRLQDLVASGT